MGTFILTNGWWGLTSSANSGLASIGSPCGGCEPAEFLNLSHGTKYCVYKKIRREGICLVDVQSGVGEGGASEVLH